MHYSWNWNVLRSLADVGMLPFALILLTLSMKNQIDIYSIRELCNYLESSLTPFESSLIQLKSALSELESSSI